MAGRLSSRRSFRHAAGILSGIASMLPADDDVAFADDTLRYNRR